ncbi:MAG: mechanosensitive ion channel [Burkholderiales bacterium]
MRRAFLSLPLLLLLALLAGMACAADAADKAKALPPERYPPATLMVFNRPVFTFRHAMLGVPPEERAVVARERIYSILERGGDDTVSVEKIDEGRLVKIGEHGAMIVAIEDVRGGEDLDAAAQGAAAALSRAISETRESRDSRLMLRAAIHSAIATAIYALLVFGLLRLGRWITRHVLRLTNATTERLKIGGTALVHRHRAIRFAHAAMRLAGFLLILIVTYEWLGFVLGRFPYTRVWSEHLNTFLVDTVVGILVAVAQAVPELAVAVVIFAIAHTVNRVQRGFFDSVQAGRVHLAWVDQDTAPATRRLATLAIWLFAAVMAYPYIPGSSTDAFKGLSVLLGLMVSVGASGIVGQVASGLILLYTRTFRKGDYVRIGDAEGTVVSMGVFTTRVRTGMGDDLTIPNATVLGTVTRNYSQGERRPGFMLEADVSIGYDVPWRQVRGLLLAAARSVPDVSQALEPRVLVTSLADFYVVYRLVCCAEPGGAQQRADVISALHAAILDQFNEHGVQIMSPHYFGDPATPKVVPRTAWYAPPAEPPAA